MSIDVEKWEAMVAASTPGRFEGEGPATAYFWDAMMNGDGEDDGEGEVLFPTTEEEKAAFDLAGDHFSIHQSEQGFIYGNER